MLIKSFPPKLSGLTTSGLPRVANKSYGNLAKFGYLEGKTKVRNFFRKEYNVGLNRV
jgi:hypothetical protein